MSHLSLNAVSVSSKHLRSFRSHFAPLFLGHSLEPTFPADLTAFATYVGHVLREGWRLYYWQLC
jgi:hypothetical protein